MSMEVRQIGAGIFAINDVLSKEECGNFIEQSEREGYDIATVKTEKGVKFITEIRNNQRVLYKNDELAIKLWERVSSLVPPKIGNSVAVGLNELFRFYKYGHGQKFKKHVDESFIRNDEEASYYTFMVYLNEGYEGGETSFDEKIVKGQTGMALVFLHSLAHEGAEVLAGIKYVLRTDIMYRLQAE